MMSPALLWAVIAVPWSTAADSQPLEARLTPPEGYHRVTAAPGSLGAWLRALPVKAGRPQVRLHDGNLKGNQSAQWLVLDVDVGRRNLQQCADAVMRLFAEWQWSANRRDEICFRYTSGHRLPWPKWAAGYRPKVRGSKVRLRQTRRPSDAYSTFKGYLRSVFTYAGTWSLSRDLVAVRDRRRIQPGDVFIRGGFPGHAVMVVDVVENASGDRMFALAQSYMPAQDIHVLRNPKADGPWYSAAAPTGRLETPEWPFTWSDLKRFDRSGCP